MKLIRIIVALIFLAMLGSGAYFYLKIYQPLYEDYNRMKSGMPELDRAKTELKKYKEREQWVPRVAESIMAGLKEEINAGNAEVVAAGDRIIVNIKEGVLYTPDSVTFSKEGSQTREKLASLLNNLMDIKNKEIYVGNSTHPVEAKRKGRLRIPARSAIDVASDRSVALVKFLEGKGVPSEFMIAAAYPSKMPEHGFKIKTDKTVIVIAQPPMISQPVVQPKPVTPPAGARPEQPKPIPIQPGPPPQR